MGKIIERVRDRQAIAKKNGASERPYYEGLSDREAAMLYLKSFPPYVTIRPPAAPVRPLWCLW